MNLHDLEWDKLRHLAIRRDVLAVADRSDVGQAVLPTCASAMVVSPPGRTGRQVGLQLWVHDRDGKVGLIQARPAAVLPLLNVAYYSLLVWDGDDGDELLHVLDCWQGSCWPGAWVAVELSRCGLDPGLEAIERFADRTGRHAELVERLVVLPPVRQPSLAAVA